MLLKGAYCVGEHFVDPHCIVCNFSSSNFRNNVSIFQENSKNTQIQVNILPFL